MNGKDVIALIIMFIKDIIDDPETVQAYRIGNSYSRNRKLSFRAVVLFLLYNGKKALSCTLADFMDDLGMNSGIVGHVTKQAISKARKNIDPGLFRRFLSVSVTTALDSFSSDNFWHKLYHLFAIDGTDIQMPQRPQCLNAYSYHKDRKSYHFAMGKGSLLYSITHELIIDFQLQKYKFSERSLAMEHIKALYQIPFSRQPLVLMDRGYFSRELCQFMDENGIKYVFRVKKNLLEVQKMIKHGDMDRIFTYKRNKTAHFTVRIIRLNLGGDAGEEYLLTNIFDRSIGLREFKDLYFMRWPIELKYRELKIIEKFEEFSSYTPESVYQDCLISCFYSNLSAVMRIDADEYIHTRCEEAAIQKAEHSQDSENISVVRYKSKISRSFERMHKKLPLMLAGNIDIVQCCQLIHEFLCLRENWSQIQSDRQYKREKKQPTRKYHYNRKSCY